MKIKDSKAKVLQIELYYKQHCCNFYKLKVKKGIKVKNYHGL